VTRESDRIETLRPARGVEETDASRRAPVAESRVDAPRGVGEILDLGFELLRERFPTVLGICVLLWLPVRLLQPFLGALIVSAASDPIASIGGLFGIAVTSLGSAAFQALASAVVALAIFSTLRGEPLGAGRALRLASRRVIGVLAISLITGVAVGFGTLLCLFPGLYFSWKLALAPSVCVIEGLGVGASLSRSLQLSTGSFARWLAMLITLFFVNAPLAGINLLFDTPTSRSQVIEELAISPVLFDALGVFATSLFSGLATAVSAVVLTVFYLDCRVRRDGLDLARRLDLLTATARAAPEPAP
jgi:hypothetical protein